VEEDKMNWDEAVANIIAHYSTGQYASTVELKNEKLCVAAAITVHSEVVQIQMYNMFSGRRFPQPFFVKTINYANPDAFDGSLTEEIEEAMHKLPPVVDTTAKENGIEIKL